jgi:hypothetical protein
MIDAALRPGYAVLVTARTLPLEDEAWLPLMRDVLQLPAWMLPAAQRSIGKGSWRYANDPLRSVRANSEREAIRMGLNERPAAKGSDSALSYGRDRPASLVRAGRSILAPVKPPSS